MVYSDKLFVLTPQGDLRILLDEGDPQLVSALEQEFFRNDVTDQTLFATGRGIAPWMASVTFGGPGLAHGLHRFSERQTHSIFLLARARASSWCIGTNDGPFAACIPAVFSRVWFWLLARLGCDILNPHCAVRIACFVLRKSAPGYEMRRSLKRISLSTLAAASALVCVLRGHSRFRSRRRLQRLFSRRIAHSRRRLLARGKWRNHRHSNRSGRRLAGSRQELSGSAILHGVSLCRGMQCGSSAARREDLRPAALKASTSPSNRATPILTSSN